MYIVTDIDIAKGHPKVSVQIILLFLSKWKKKQAFATIHKLEIRHAKTKCQFGQKEVRGHLENFENISDEC